MNSVAVLLGTTLCCGVPLLSFALGVLYARRGLPFAVRYRWSRSYEGGEHED